MDIGVFGRKLVIEALSKYIGVKCKDIYGIFLT